MLFSKQVIRKPNLALPAVAALVLFCSMQASLAQSGGSSGGSSGGGGGASTGATGTGATVVISGNSQTVEKTVKNAAVKITGDANTVTIKGKVTSLMVNGDENGVRVEKVQTVMTKGDGNLVKWKSGPPPSNKPQVNNTGTHNTVEKDDGGSLQPPMNPLMNTSNAAKTGQ